MQAAATAISVSIHTILCYFSVQRLNEPLLGLSIFTVIKRLGMDYPAGHLYHERAQYGITVHSVSQPFVTRGFLCALLFSWYAEALNFSFAVAHRISALARALALGKSPLRETPGIVMTISRYRQNSKSRSSLRRMSEGRSSRAQLRGCPVTTRVSSVSATRVQPSFGNGLAW